MQLYCPINFFVYFKNANKLFSAINNNRNSVGWVSSSYRKQLACYNMKVFFQVLANMTMSIPVP
jgi:hypothetical protein